MSVASFEMDIVITARSVSGDSSLTRARLMEWSSGEIKPQDGETTYHLPSIGVWATFADKKPKKKK